MWAVLGSFAASIWLPLRSTSKFADLSNWYSDHLHHAYAVWVFGARGFDVYRMGFGAAARGVAYPHSVVTWEANPMVYPPGVFLIFAPPALLGHFWPMTQPQFASVNIVWLLVLAHLALFAFWWSLARAPSGTRGLMAVVVWFTLLRLALNGFYDVVFLGCAAMMAVAASKGRHGAALLWCGAAAFTHYRAAVLLPLAVWLVLELIKQRPLRLWPWPALTGSTVLGLIALYTFLLMYPHSTAGSKAPSLLSLFQQQTLPWVVTACGVVFIALSHYFGGWVAGSTAAIVVVVGLLELPVYSGAWWHACMALAAPLLADVPRALGSRDPSRLRQVGLALMFTWQALVFGDRSGALGLLTQIAKEYHAR